MHARNNMRGFTRLGWLGLAALTLATLLIVGIQLARFDGRSSALDHVQISTWLPGASAQEVADRITGPLEDVLRVLPDVRLVESSSSEYVSEIRVYFHRLSAKQRERRMAELRREINTRAQRSLPASSSTPSVVENATPGGLPSMLIGVLGLDDDANLQQAATIARDELARLQGVEQISAFGLRVAELQINLDVAALTARGLRLNDAADSVAAAFNQDVGGQTVVGHDQWRWRMVGDNADPQALAGLVIARSDTDFKQAVTTLGEVASIELGYQTAQQAISIDDRPAVLLALNNGPQDSLPSAAINAYLATQNERLSARGLRFVVLDSAPGTRSSRQSYFDFELNPNTTLSHTHAEGKRLSERIRRQLAQADLRTLGVISGVQWSPSGARFGDHRGQLIVAASLSESQQQALLKDLQLHSGTAQLHALNWTEPPDKSDFKVRLRSNDAFELRRATNAVKRLLEALPGASNVNDDQREGRSQLLLRPEPDALQRSGLSLNEFKRTLALLGAGEVPAQLRVDGANVAVRVRAKQPDREDIAQLLDEPILLTDGRRAPLSTLVAHEQTVIPETIRHYQFQRSLLIHAQLDAKTTSEQTARDTIQNGWNKIELEHPRVELTFEL